MKLLCLALCLVAVGCASQEHRDALTLYQSQCNAGNAQYCLAANQQAEANHSEAMDNAGTAAAIVLLLPLAILVGLSGGGDDDDDEVDSFGRHHFHHHPAPHWHR